MGFEPTPDILVVAAMREEILDFIRGCVPISRDHRHILNRYWEPSAWNGRVGFFCCGVGRKRARRNMAGVMRVLRPRRILVAGFAGALTSEASVGDILLIRATCHDSSGPESAIPFDSAFTRSIASRLDAERLPYSEESAVTVDRIVDSRPDRENLRITCTAACVDMESHHIAGLPEVSGIPIAMIRTISDFADETLGLDLNRLPSGKWRFRMHFLLHPGQIPALFRLRRNMHKASRSLARALEHVLQPESSPA